MKPVLLTTPLPGVIPMTPGPVELPGRTDPSQEAHGETATLSPVPMPVTVATGTGGPGVHLTDEDAPMGPQGAQDVVVVVVFSSLFSKNWTP